MGEHPEGSGTSARPAPFGRRLPALPLAVALAAAAVALPAVGARAVDVPVVGDSLYIQTNGLNSAIGLGDWYAASAAQGGGATSHRLRINIPCSWPAGLPVHVDLFGAPMTSSAAVQGRARSRPALSTRRRTRWLAREAPRTPRSSGRSRSPRPGSASSPSPTAAPAAASGRSPTRCSPSTRSTPARTPTTRTAGGCGSPPTTMPTPPPLPPHRRTTPTGSPAPTTRSSWGSTAPRTSTMPAPSRARRCGRTSTRASPASASTTSTWTAADGCATTRRGPPSTPAAPAAVSPATLSANARWNGSTGTTRAGDLVNAPATGWWAIVSCISNHNQLIQEGASSGTSYLSQPRHPRWR